MSMKLPHHNRIRKRFSLRRDAFICVFLAITTLAAYGNVVKFDFVYDDESYITKNGNVQAGLTPESVAWSFTATDAHNWHPATWLSHLLDYQLFGMNSGMHHLTSLLFHVANSLLLFLVLRNMTGDVWRSGIVAALFALHPLNVESVAWVAERKNVLSTFFWMLAIGAYVRYTKRPGLSGYVLVLLFFILGLLSKPMLVTFPFVLLLLDYWPLCRFQFRKSDNGPGAQQRTPVLHLLREKAPFLAIAVAFCIITVIVQHIRSLEAYPPAVRVANALVSYMSYIGKMIWPSRLAPIYLHPGTVAVWRATGAGLLLACVSMMAARTRRKHPYFIVGWLWYLGTLVPVIGLVQIGLQSMADRYAYVPLIGLFIIIAWGIPSFGNGWRCQRVVLGIVTVMLLMGITMRTWMQVQHWENSITLFEHAVRVTPNNYVAQYNLACGYAMANRKEEAIGWLDKSIKNGNKYWNIIKTDTDLESIRESAYYKNLMKAMAGD